jgi:hypothetical protein
MAKSRIDLTYQVLRELGALPDGMDPPDEDKNRVDALIDPIVEDWPLPVASRCTLSSTLALAI